MAPLKNISGSVLLPKCQDSTLWSIMSLVRYKVLPLQRIFTMIILKVFLSVPICLKITGRSLHRKCWFSGPVIIQGTCDTTLGLEGVHLCHVLKHWLRRLYHYLLPAKNKMKILVKIIGMNEWIYMVKAYSKVRRLGWFYEEDLRIWLWMWYRCAIAFTQ